MKECTVLVYMMECTIQVPMMECTVQFIKILHEEIWPALVIIGPAYQELSYRGYQ